MLAATATITNNMRNDVISRLDMKECKLVSASPDRPNINYFMTRRTTIEEDLKHIVVDLKENSINANGVIILLSISHTLPFYHILPRPTLDSSAILR